MKVNLWLMGWIAVVFTILGISGYQVYKVDPFFHYHKPDTETYYYKLNNQRSQNDGIVRYFDYDAIITGSSMTENFRTSEANKLYDCNAIKIPFSGASFKELNDYIRKGLLLNTDIKLVIRCLDSSRFLDSYDYMSTKLGTYPTYLYDDNPLNDVEYLLNREVLFGRVYAMEQERTEEGFKPGIDSFDKYSSWRNYSRYGINKIFPDGKIVYEDKGQIHLTEEDRERIKKNIKLNVTDLADEYPNVDFYYFYPPYSILYWADKVKTKNFYRYYEAEVFITELILEHDNIHLYSFNNRTDITTDLNNYKDTAHYGSWINSLILKWMHDGRYQLTKDNYKQYLKEEYEFYTTFDFKSLNGQEDYENDAYAPALLNQELTGAEPIDVLNSDRNDISLIGDVHEIKDGKDTVVQCEGAQFSVNLDDGYGYLVFEGQKIGEQGSMTVYVYNDKGTVLRRRVIKAENLDNEKHQYAIDMSTAVREVTVSMNLEETENSNNTDSEFLFSNIYMY